MKVFFLLALSKLSMAMFSLDGPYLQFYLLSGCFFVLFRGKCSKFESRQQKSVILNVISQPQHYFPPFAEPRSILLLCLEKCLFLASKCLSGLERRRATWPWNITAQGEKFDRKQCPRSSFDAICVGVPQCQMATFLCTGLCLPYVTALAIGVAHVEDQKPCLQHLCSEEAIWRSSRVAVRRNGRAGGVTAAPSDQIGQFPRQAPFFNISSSSKLSLSNDATFPVQEACNFCEITLLNWGEENWKSQVAGHWACCADLFSGQSRSARQRKKPWQLLPRERGDQTSILCVGEPSEGEMRQELKGRGANGRPKAKCSPP